MGIVLVVSIQPGSGNTSELSNEENKRNVTTADTLMDLIRNAFPPNLVEACIKQTSTVLVYPGTDDIPKEDWAFKSTMGGSMNILGMIHSVEISGFYYRSDFLSEINFRDFGS